jgi:molecular chaperone DnaK (HSP70)
MFGRMLAWISKEFFGSRSTAPEPTPPSQALEDIAIDDTAITGRHPDLVVDFGTTATVVCMVSEMRDPDGQRDVRLSFLAGETEHPSDLTVNAAGEVAKVGSAAFGDSRSSTANRYYTSLKRYLEMESRGATQEIGGAGLTFGDIVSGYLQESIRNAYTGARRKIGPTSRVVISIPNSFNPTAVDDVRQGVIKAITALNGRVAPITSANIRIARESEAVGYLYRRGNRGLKAPASGQSTTVESFEWETLPAGGRVGPPTGDERIIVLDVGGGTTDLSLLRIREVETEPGETGVEIDVLMNAGMPIGGTDVDKLLFRSALDPMKTTAGDLAGVDLGQRHQILKTIRTAKEADADQFFVTPTDPEKDSFLNVLNNIVTGIKSVDLTRGNATDVTAADFRREANQGMSTLTQLSVAGLFGLIPQTERDGVTKILLTGRASKLRQVRDAVLEEARKLGATVLTLKHAYHLKLAVAYGCALVRNHEFSGDKLPSGTLGRQLRVFGAGNKPAMEFDGTLPVSGIAPTLWHLSCPRRNGPVSYEVWEYNTSVSLDFLNNTAYTADQTMWLGCSRPVAAWEVAPRGAGEPNRELLLARHPATEAYYVVDGNPPRWTAPEPVEFDATGINLVTGLPLGFPYEVSK